MKEFIQKNKKWVIALSIIFVILVLCIVLNFAVFSLRKVEVDFQNEPLVFASEESKSLILEDKSIKVGGSIFTVNKKEIKNNLEKNNEYLKVINIETVFPNKIIIHCAEREETYAIRAFKNEDLTKYFICDAEFKVLSTPYFSDGENEYVSTQTNAILVDGLENLIANKYRVNPGDFLEFTSETKILQEIGKGLLKTNKTVAMQKALIKSIKFTSGIYYYTAKNQPYIILTDFNGFKTNVYALDTLLKEKFETMFLCLSQVVYNPSVMFKTELDKGEITLESLSETYYLDYTLKIMEDLKSKLVVRLEKNKNS